MVAKTISVGLYLISSKNLNLIILYIRTYTVRLADVASHNSDTPAQFYESLFHYVALIPTCNWFKKFQEHNQLIKNEALVPCIRKLCYAMNGLYKNMCNGTILSCLLTLSEFPKENDILIEVNNYFCINF